MHRRCLTKIKMSPQSIFRVRLQRLNIHLLVWNRLRQCHIHDSEDFEPAVFEAPILELGHFFHVVF